MRSMSHPEYSHRPQSAEHKAKLSAFHRKRWGAPEGMATVWGVHVPFEHRTPIRYWSDLVNSRAGRQKAAAFIKSLADNDWRDVPELWRLYHARKDIAETRRIIKEMNWELTYGYPNNPRST